MLDFGWPELFLIIAIAILVIGPDEIPVVMVTLGRVMRRLSYVRYAISQQFEDVMRDADLDDIRKSVNFEAKDEHGNDIEFDEAAADEEYAMGFDGEYSKADEADDVDDVGADEGEEQEDKKDV